LVTSRFDWWYFESTRSAWIFSLSIPSALIGFFVPIILPVSLYLIGIWRKSFTLKNIAAVLGQAAILGWLVSSSYKAFTGRIQPEFLTHLSNIDASRNFNFGFFEHGIFWGWPSSHVTVAFAMAAALIALYPRRKEITLPVAMYASYMILGVSVTIHWFSDAIAGAIIGTVIGLVVAKTYQKRRQIQ
jgi:membrane-associated phospholipid phosphatase